jgi:multisubunit Na+/H+ antiporter MnhB subunit
VWVIGNNTLMDFVSIFTTVIYLFYIAFGPQSMSENVWAMVCWIEVLYGIEMTIHFFTALSDPETFQVITSLKKIASTYIWNGTFLPELIAVFPF